MFNVLPITAFSHKLILLCRHCDTYVVHRNEFARSYGTCNTTYNMSSEEGESFIFHNPELIGLSHRLWKVHLKGWFLVGQFLAFICCSRIRHQQTWYGASGRFPRSHICSRMNPLLCSVKLDLSVINLNIDTSWEACRDRGGTSWLSFKLAIFFPWEPFSGFIWEKFHLKIL